MEETAAHMFLYYHQFGTMWPLIQKSIRVTSFDPLSVTDHLLQFT